MGIQSGEWHSPKAEINLGLLRQIDKYAPDKIGRELERTQVREELIQPQIAVKEYVELH